MNIGTNTILYRANTQMNCGRKGGVRAKKMTRWMNRGNTVYLKGAYCVHFTFSIAFDIRTIELLKGRCKTGRQHKKNDTETGT